MTDFFSCPSCDTPTKWPWPSGHTCNCGFYVPIWTPYRTQSFDPEDPKDLEAFRTHYTKQVGMYLDA